MYTKGSRAGDFYNAVKFMTDSRYVCVFVPKEKDEWAN